MSPESIYLGNLSRFWKKDVDTFFWKKRFYGNRMNTIMQIKNTFMETFIKP